MKGGDRVPAYLGCFGNVTIFSQMFHYRRQGLTCGVCGVEH